jgi:hypothetical protein
VPADLSNVVAIAAAEHLSLALKRDGTVAAWGGNYFGQTSVPAGLSNVVAVAAGGWFSMAITTGAVPASVYVQPHGRLEEMEREADFVFKGQVIASSALTNTSFPSWAKPHATQFRLVSVFKGKPKTNEPVLWHYTAGPMGWGGGSPPSWYQFETGQCYLVFAAKLDRPDYLYTPPSDATNRPNEYRQLYCDCVTRTIDDRPLVGVSTKEAHWLELNRLLTDATPTNSLYAIQRLNGMSKSCLASWGHSGNFTREAVLSAVMPLVTNPDDKVAVAAIGCFQLGGNNSTWINDQGGWIPILRGCAEVQPECVSQVSPYAPALVRVANESTSPSRRMAAVAAFSCTRFPIVSNALPRWLRDPADEVRAQAVLLLPDYPGNCSEHWLREMASDASPTVRAVTADAIGNGTMTNLLPTLVQLFSDPAGRDHPLPPLTVDDLEAGGRAGMCGDVHTSAGFALLKFDVNDVGEILKTNLSTRGFRLSFIRKLAPDGDKSYLPLLAQELTTHTANSEQEAAKNGFHWGLSYWLSGNYGWAWDTLFEYVSAQTREGLNDPHIVAVLDSLQIADDPGEARTRSLYGFLLDKGLIERAKELRRGIIRRTEDKAINKESFGFPEKLKLFDEMDEKYGLKPGLGL